MCGIVGIVDRQHPADERLLQAMSGAIVHRGPDDQGLYLDQGPGLSVGLATRRLSILDLSAAGHMPMQSRSGQTVISYNGEIYNYLELRAELEAQGCQFRSRTDTETILYAYELYGLDCLKRLNGMFALAIYDQRRQQLVLARDPLGIKPLYYTWQDGRLLFASELKALLSSPDLPRRINPEALDIYLSLGYVPAPHCLIDGVQRLEAGQMLVITADGSATQEFWSGGYDVAQSAQSTDAELIAEIRQTLEAAIERQLMSDVPVGILLSGGVDSTIVAAVAQRQQRAAINTFSIRFGQREGPPAEDLYNVDSVYAQLAAQRIGTRHHEVLLDGSIDLEGLLRTLSQQLDEPVWEASFLSIYLMCQLAREVGVKVVLTGDGSDELFAGYSWYRGLERLLQYQRLPLLRKVLPTLAWLFPGRQVGQKAADLQQKLQASSLERYRLTYDLFSRAEKARLLGRDPTDSDRADPVDQLIAPILERAGGTLSEQFAFADLRLWVGEHFNHRLDRMSMAASVEARVPFQDLAVVDLALKIPTRRKIQGAEQKYLLRQAFADLLPPEILARPKRPFAAPQHDWFRGRLRIFAGDVLSEERVGAVGALDPAEVRAVYERYLSGQERYSQKLSILVMFQLWAEQVLLPAPQGCQAR